MNRINSLFDKYKNNQCTAAEIAELLDYFNIDDNKELLNTNIDNALNEHNVADDEELENDTQAVYATLQTLITQTKGTRKLIQFKWAAAAAILLIAGTALYYFTNTHSTSLRIAHQKFPDIAPGRNQATLTLANGQKIILTKGLNGKLAQLGNTLVNAQVGNGISYIADATNTPVAETFTYNTLTTARGEQSPYPLILADGTKVWLNAASSITFPTKFQGSERRVKVTGEVYFEVVHNAAKPFFVSLKNEDIEDIGTHFDINAYDDEPVTKTTLLEGSVKVTSDKQMALLKPGQQSIVKNGNSFIQVANVNLKQAVAWRNGKFIFRSESVEAVMRQISRWYNVDIIYKDNIANKEVWGTVDRYGNVSEVLDMLELTGVAHFKVAGKTITVTK